MSTTIQKPPMYRVGDWVAFPYGAVQARAKITEDRGAIGVDGRRLYRVRMYHDAGASNTRPAKFEFEVPEPVIEAAQLDSRDVMDYLKAGALIKILRRNNGDNPSCRVWLGFNDRGRISATLHKERGLVGGEVIPCRATNGQRIFEPERQAVVHFLTSFGLDTKQAEDVVEAVGVA